MEHVFFVSIESDDSMPLIKPEVSAVVAIGVEGLAALVLAACRFLAVLRVGLDG